MGTLSLILAWLSACGHPSKEDFLFTSPQEVLGFVMVFFCLFILEIVSTEGSQKLKAGLV